MAEASPLTIFTTAVNFALGAGVLGLPYAMASAGIVASVLSLVIVAAISFLTCSWLLEVGDRANAEKRSWKYVMSPLLNDRAAFTPVLYRVNDFTLNLSLPHIIGYDIETPGSHTAA